MTWVKLIVFAPEKGRLKMTGRIKLSVLFLGSAALIVVAIAAGAINQANSNGDRGIKSQVASNYRAWSHGANNRFSNSPAGGYIFSTAPGYLG